MGLRLKSLIGGIVVTAALLSGCKPSQPAPDAGKSEAHADATTAAKPPPDARMAPDDPMKRPDAGMPQRDTTPVDAAIGSVTLSDQGDTEKNTLGMPVTRFSPKDSIYAEIQSEGTSNEYTIYAKWIGADGVVLADYGIKLNAAGPSRTVISLSKPDGWPRGKNRIELAINGKAQRTVTFDVQ